MAAAAKNKITPTTDVASTSCSPLQKHLVHQSYMKQVLILKWGFFVCHSLNIFFKFSNFESALKNPLKNSERNSNDILFGVLIFILTFNFFKCGKSSKKFSQLQLLEFSILLAYTTHKIETISNVFLIYSIFTHRISTKTQFARSKTWSIFGENLLHPNFDLSNINGCLF